MESPSTLLASVGSVNRNTTSRVVETSSSPLAGETSETRNDSRTGTARSIELSSPNESRVVTLTERLPTSAASAQGVPVGYPRMTAREESARVSQQKVYRPSRMIPSTVASSPYGSRPAMTLDRSKTIVEARREAIIKVRAETTLSIAEMGDVFGYADHVTVYMVLKKYKERPLNIVKMSKT